MISHRELHGNQEPCLEYHYKMYGNELVAHQILRADQADTMRCDYQLTCLNWRRLPCQASSHNEM
jgi:hypothetical protein